MRKIIMAASALALLTAAGAASAQTSIQPGRSVNGELTSRDTRWAGDNTPMDCYVLRTTAGQSYTVDYRSGAFDAFLAAGPGRNCQGSGQTVFDDDSGGGPRGLDSRLTIAGDGSDWFIRANAIAEDSAGAYTLAVTTASAPAAPRAPAKPPSGGGGGGGGTTTAAAADDDSIFTYLAICMAADIVETTQGVRDTDARTAESMQIFELLMMAGEEEGMSEDDITTAVADYVTAWTSDEELMRSSPPAQTRRECLTTIEAAG